jgi:hypothetical protein
MAPQADEQAFLELCPSDSSPDRDIPSFGGGDVHNYK